MIDPAVGALLVGCFALLFASAALHKLRGFARFGAVLRAYQVLPEGAARLAGVVPVLELSVAVGLLAGAPRTFATLAGAVLLVCYAGAIALNLGRGRRDLACGCGGADQERPIAPWMVWRNCGLALLLAAQLTSWTGRPLLATDALTIGAGMAAAALLYMSLDRLFGRVTPRTAALRGPG
ncbi:MAG: MauE/DoxX family redox-associated membrane protein [Steroidobacteraceae bacterium]